jgi:hypothetical protein
MDQLLMAINTYQEWQRSPENPAFRQYKLEEIRGMIADSEGREMTLKEDRMPPEVISFYLEMVKDLPRYPERHSKVEVMEVLGWMKFHLLSDESEFLCADDELEIVLPAEAAHFFSEYASPEVTWDYGDDFRYPFIYRLLAIVAMDRWYESQEEYEGPWTPEVANKFLS